MKFATSKLFLAISPAIQVNSFTRSHSSFVTHIHLSGLLQLSHHLSRNEGATMLAGLIDFLSTWFQHRWVFVIRTWSCQLPRRANTTHSIIGKTFLQTPLPHPTYSSVFHHEVRLTLSTASTVHWSRNWNLMPWSCIYQKLWNSKTTPLLLDHRIHSASVASLRQTQVNPRSIGVSEDSLFMMVNIDQVLNQWALVTLLPMNKGR